MPSRRILIAAFVILCLGFLWKRSKKVHDRTDRNEARREEKAPQILPNEPKPSTPAATENAFSSSKKRMGREIALGLKRIDVDVLNSKIRFRLRTKIDGSSCQTGDFDQIKSLVHSPKEKILQLSVEPMPGSEGGVQKFPVNLLEIINGIPFDVQLPISKEPVYYGTYLCTLDKQGHACGKMPSMAGKDWKAASKGVKIPGKNIHFQMLALRGEELFLLPSSNWDKKTLARLQETIEGSKGQLNPAFASMRDRLSHLTSLQGIVSGNALELNLPYRNPDCNL